MENHLDSVQCQKALGSEGSESRGLVNCSPEVPFPYVNESHAENVFLHRYNFCSSETVQEDVLQSLYPC